MTIPSELQLTYSQVELTLKKLKVRCDPLLNGVAHSLGGRYHPGRIKPIESVLLKIEKDGPASPFREIDDLFAATIIVPNETLIPRSEEEIEIGKVFEIVEKVPPKTKNPEQFIYDDRHLILKLRHEPGREDSELVNIRFELQIKTELQAAASIVSRELSYKTRWLSWTRARLASSIRALIEMADSLLARLVESAEGVGEPPEEAYEMFASYNRVIHILEQTLSPMQMPEDRRRLAITVQNYLSLCKPPISPQELKEMLEKADYTRIRESVSLSAAGSVFIVLFLEHRLSTNTAEPASSLRGNRRYLITSEMIDLCPVLKQIPETRRVNLNPRLAD